jgi:predicted DNA-binding transcriptional regulator AlpA
MSVQSSIAESLRHFDALPDSAHVKQPVVQSLFACSHSSVWRRVKAGTIPPPRKFGSSSVWNVGELRAALSNSGI